MSMGIDLTANDAAMGTNAIVGTLTQDKFLSVAALYVRAARTDEPLPWDITEPERLKVTQ